MTIDPALFRATLAQWASGVSIVTTLDDDRPHGMTVSSFTSLSLEPSLIQFSVGKKSSTHQFIEQSGVFAVNILQERQLELGKRFSGKPPDDEDRFQGVPYSIAVTGAPILSDVNAWLDCRLYRAYDGGDHTLFVGEVVTAAAQPIEEPLLYFNRHWGTFEASKSKTRLTHVVMMRLTEPTAENLNLLRSQLLALQTTIPQIKEIEVGINVVPSERAYDLVLLTRFDSLASMQEYQTHPDHQRVLTEVIRPHASSIVAVDYEDIE
jgi:flavin reductase (DIM6/NTAB) family NADH-FMN oxidoreductase RutF